MLESELRQASLTASFVLCTQLFPLNSRPMTGPGREKKRQVHLYITTLVSEDLQIINNYTIGAATEKRRTGSLILTADTERIAVHSQRFINF